ncbi:NAD(P)/FAD-dependent oxidoreductase [Comamonadaceae bacterium OH2545_COT-014]|nr:NAD(P)/FAD-dependent oxidoreductase [Comamonadaceae bacterium OH2545_COT-014]
MPARPQPAPLETDAVIIGAGPVGLFQVFELGLLEARAHVIDALPQVGGQPVALYPGKPIYDIPALAVCTGQELADALMRQIAPFEPVFHLGQQVSHLARQADGRFLVETTAGTRLMARAVFIAAGVGAFQPRPLKAPGAAGLEGTHLLYHLPPPARLAGQRVVVAGGGDQALEWAIRLASATGHDAPACVTLLHRRDAFTAAPETVARMRALSEAGSLRLAFGPLAGLEAEHGRLTRLTYTGADGATQFLPVDTLLASQGMSPRLGPVADWGLAMERKQLVVDTEKFQTSEPGIFAVGDINTYPGKKKLILCGFHEATLAAYGALPYLFPGKDVFFQYTTTSPRLHRLLGVAPEAADDPPPASDGA